jgi:tRNA A22 N-methylase
MKNNLMTIIIMMTTMVSSVTHTRAFSTISINRFCCRVQRFQLLLAHRLYSTSIYNHDDNKNYDDRTIQARSKVEEAFNLLARQGKTWKRLSHIVDMAIIEENNNQQNTLPIVADIGTDHGLLALGLALSGKFHKVIGVDVSDNALENGALSLLKRVQKRTHNEKEYKNNIPIEFLLGDGLYVLDHADIICIAGMGVHSMINILDQKQQQMNNVETLELTRIGCKRLIVQPTNSRPSHLILLYNKLQNDGWKVENERIERLSSRWYITTSFRKQVRENDDGVNNEFDEEEEIEHPMVLPGSILSTTMTDSHPMYQIFEEYCYHHTVWIEEDSKAGRNVDPQEDNWLHQFRKPSL